jgi:hypothetical protein
MKDLLKKGLVVPMAVLVALAVVSFVAVADEPEAQNDKRTNQDLNRALNDKSVRERASISTVSANDTEDDGTALNSETATLGSRRATIDRRGREASGGNVTLTSERSKWWWSHSINEDDEDEGEDEAGDEDEDGDVSPSDV